MAVLSVITRRTFLITITAVIIAGVLIGRSRPSAEYYIVLAAMVVYGSCTLVSAWIDYRRSGMNPVVKLSLLTGGVSLWICLAAIMTGGFYYFLILLVIAVDYFATIVRIPAGKKDK